MNFLDLRDDDTETEKPPPPSTSTRDAVESAIERAKGDRNSSWDEAIKDNKTPLRDYNSKNKKVASSKFYEQ